MDIGGDDRDVAQLHGANQAFAIRNAWPERSGHYRQGYGNDPKRFPLSTDIPRMTSKFVEIALSPLRVCRVAAPLVHSVRQPLLLPEILERPTVS